ncbi:MAG: hypothetical protein M1608_03950 [Candidatus Omnitrophica bacterium]|nr:hypothetical protein [Candidatus Omnitrophota bacterium]
MKKFLGPRTPRPIDRSAAWACLLANLLVLPGLGSLTAGRRTGYFQAAFALAGLVLTAQWAAWFAIEWVHRGQMPQGLGPYFRNGLLGIALFVLAWCWSLASSIWILNSAVESPPSGSKTKD